MTDAFNFVQIVLSVLLVVVILLQVKGIGSGFFGEAYSTFRTRRGVERILFRLTIVLAVVFVATSLASARVA